VVGGGYMAAKGIQAAGEAAASLRAPRSVSFGDLEPGVYGETDPATGHITIQRGLTGQDLVETLRHETVHSVISQALGRGSGARGWLYGKSSVVRYAEEALAEGYATRSLSRGLAFPLTNGYVSPWGLGIEVGGILAGLGLFGATR